MTVVDQSVKFGRKEGDLYVEVHPTHAQLDEIEASGTMTMEQTPDQTDRVLTVASPDEIPRIDWIAVDRAFSERRGLPVRITRPAPAVHSGPYEPRHLGSPDLGTGTMAPLEKSGPATGPLTPADEPHRSMGPPPSRG